MLNVSKPRPNRLTIELSGALDAEEMKSALDHLIEQSKDISNGRMLYTITDFEIPTLGAMAAEFQRMPKLFRLIENFEKCAVLSDTAWIRTAAEFEGAVLPSLKIKSFTLDEVEAAEAWLEDRDQEEGLEDDDYNFPV